MMPNANPEKSANQAFRILLIALLAACVFAALAHARAGSQSQAAAAPLDVENAQVVNLEHQWLQTQNTGNVAQLDKILASDFVRPDPAEGEFITKAEMMTYLHSHPFPHHAGPAPQFSQLRVTIYGNVAIARGILTATDAQNMVVLKTL
ncbi:MAG: nuclear transport factor 2 family protein, partial [Acidobacteriota bacterium]|nr:nuclear transport factor 2 family protein [Acidobacteriota bacterium]